MSLYIGDGKERNVYNFSEKFSSKVAKYKTSFPINAGNLFVERLEVSQKLCQVELANACMSLVVCSAFENFCYSFNYYNVT
jgi:hypothetical protein